jgi:hypothetical protein
LRWVGRGLGAGGLAGEFGAHGGEEVDHGEGDAGGFGAAIHGGAEAAFFGLVGVVEQEDFMDDRDAVGGGGALEGIGDGGADEVGVFGGATKDDAEGNDGIWRGAAEDEFGADGDFEGTGDAVGGDGDVGGDFLEFVFGGIEEAFDVGLIVEAGDDGDGEVLLSGAGAVGDGAGHF